MSNIEENSHSTPEEILTGIQADLKSETSRTRLAAIQKLAEIKYSSPAILRILEGLALKDKSKSVREAARLTLTSPAHRYIQGRTSKLERKERQAILEEIGEWEKQGIIQADQADVIRQRYDFDLKSAAPPQDLPSPTTQPRPTSATPDKDASLQLRPATPRPGLTQTLLSETSIKIALYLGASS